MQVEIKTAEIKDAEVVFSITKQAFQNYLDPAFSAQIPALQESKKEVKQDIEQKEVLVAYIDGQPAGSVRFYPLQNGKYHLSRLGVLDKYQGCQVGCELIKAVESKVGADGGRKVVLYSAYQRQELLDFYNDLGYELKEITDDDDYRRAKLVKKI